MLNEIEKAQLEWLQQEDYEYHFDEGEPYCDKCKEAEKVTIIGLSQYCSACVALIKEEWLPKLLAKADE